MSALAVSTDELTPASVWQSAGGGAIGDELLEWPPDLFALTDVLLERSEAYRFALSRRAMRDRRRPACRAGLTRWSTRAAG